MSRAQEPWRLRQKFDGAMVAWVFIITLIADANPRDYPVARIPLYYVIVLAYLLIFVKPRGLRRLLTRMATPPVVAVLILWFYLLLVALLRGPAVRYEMLALLFQPLAGLAVGASLSLRHRGISSGLAGFLLGVTVSVTVGFIALAVPDIVAGYRNAVFGASMLNSAYDLDVSQAAVVGALRNTGLGLSVHTFSYLLVAATCAVIGVWTLRGRQNRLAQHLGFLALSIFLFAALVSNAERSALLATAVSCSILLAFARGRSAILLILIAFILAGVGLLYAGSFLFAEEPANVFQRFSQDNNPPELRFQAALAALQSPLHDPLGSGGRSTYYEQRVSAIGFVRSDGSFTASHNHFANYVMYAGVLGLFTISWLGIEYLRLAFYIVLHYRNNPFVLASLVALFGAILNSFAHSGGLLNGEYATALLSGMLFALVGRQLGFGSRRHRRASTRADGEQGWNAPTTHTK